VTPNINKQKTGITYKTTTTTTKITAHKIDNGKKSQLTKSQNQFRIRGKNWEKNSQNRSSQKKKKEPETVAWSWIGNHQFGSHRLGF